MLVSPTGTGQAQPGAHTHSLPGQGNSQLQNSRIASERWAQLLGTCQAHTRDSQEHKPRRVILSFRGQSEFLGAAGRAQKSPLHGVGCRAEQGEELSSARHVPACSVHLVTCTHQTTHPLLCCQSCCFSLSILLRQGNCLCV